MTTNLDTPKPVTQDAAVPPGDWDLKVGEAGVDEDGQTVCAEIGMSSTK